MLKADGPDNISIPATTATVASNSMKVTMPLTASEDTLPNTIKFYNRSDSTAFYLEWQVSFDGGNTWSAVQKTNHTVYATLNDPQTSHGQETIFYLGCKDQGNQTDPGAVASTIFSKFTSLSVCRVGTTAPMIYWGKWATSGDAQHESPNCFETAGLLLKGDGRCGAWARFLFDIFAAQGLSGAQVENIDPIGYTDGMDGFGIYVKRWDMSNPTIPRPLKGIAGQGNLDPRHYFDSKGAHAMVSLLGILYDPSYGKKYSNSSMDANRQAWEDNSLEGVKVVNHRLISIIPHVKGIQQTQMTP